MSQEIQQQEATPQKYSRNTTIRKMAVSFIVIAGPGILADLTTTGEVGRVTGITLAAAILRAFWKGMENWRKNSRGDGQPVFTWEQAFDVLLKSILPLVLLGVLFCGCVTTRFENSYTRTDGTVSTTKWLAISSAWPGGKIDTANQTMDTTFGGGHMATGQAAAGLDNTGITQVLLEVLKLIPAPVVP